MNKFYVKFFVLDASQFNLVVNSNSNKNFNNNNKNISNNNRNINNSNKNFNNNNNTKNFNKNLKNNNNRNINNGKFLYYSFHTTQFDLNKFGIKFSIKFPGIIKFKFPYYIVIIKFPGINYIKINNVIDVRQLQKSEART